ncbi:RNA polymerase sigma factor [Nocardia sp. NPDC048505]|uniref:RNA polymerase sigma factor n=1 Tax=unclassified Nocardia TaxID=2637762 RepID=UPI0033DD41E8
MDPLDVVAAQRGDALAMDRLIDDLAPYVHRLCRRIDPAVAEDATQEALLAIFRSLPSLQAPEAIMTWVRSITIRTALRYARRLRSEVAVAELPENYRVASIEDTVDIDDILARLPAGQRAVMALRLCDDLSEEEIATELKIPIGTVKSRLHRARATFRRMWEL